MTIDDIANYCEVKECRVVLGEPESGYISVDGNGLMARDDNYRRFLALRELASLPDPTQVLARANSFVIDQFDGRQSMTREEFVAELQRLQQLVEA